MANKKSKIFTDKNGKDWLVDRNGKFLRDQDGKKIPPTHSKKTTNKSDFTTYDSSQGHCGLCGRSSCRGTCFK